MRPLNMLKKNKSSKMCPFCQKRMKCQQIRCSACGKLSYILVMMTGPPLSLKSVVASYLQKHLKIALISSAYLGPVMNMKGQTDGLLRIKRRDRMNNILDIYLHDKLPVIADAAYQRKMDRKEFLNKFHKKFSHISIIMVCCYSKDKVIREYRRRIRNTPDKSLELDTMSSKESKRLLQEYDRPHNDRLPETGIRIPLVYFDTDHFDVKLYNIPKNKAVTSEMKNIKAILVRGISVGDL